MSACSGGKHAEALLHPSHSQPDYVQKCGCSKLVELLCQLCCVEVDPDAVRDASFVGADGFSFGFAAGEAVLVVAVALGVGSGDLGDGGGVDGFVDLSVSASVEAVSLDTSGAGLDGCGAVGLRERCFGLESCGVAGVDQDFGCDEVADAVSASNAGSTTTTVTDTTPP